MRQSALILTLVAVLFISAGLVYAQEPAEVEITIFRDHDSLTIYVPEQGEVSLNGLTFEVTVRRGDTEQTITRPIHSFPEFRILQFEALIAPLCLRLEKHDTQSPVPLDCAEGDLYLQALNEDDVFWYDASFNLNRLVTVKSGGEVIDFCGDDCSVAYSPSSFTIPASIPDCTANIDEHEILVLISKFDQLSAPDLFPQREWESILNEAIDELGNSVNARVFLLEDTIITSHDEARAYSDLCQATLTIWGEIGRARIESSYTVSPRWGIVEAQSIKTTFKAQQSLDEFEIFVSAIGGDSPYVLQFVLGQLAYYAKEYETALTFFDQALGYDLNGREIELGVDAVYFFRGYIHHPILEDREAALTDYNKSIELDSQSVNAFTNRGAVRGDLGDWEGAFADYEKAIELDSQAALPFYNRGIAYRAQGYLEEAIADFDRAIKLNPIYHDAHVARGKAYHELGDMDSALTDFNQAIEINPERFNGYWSRGNVRKAQGDLEAAITDFDRAIELDPNHFLVFWVRGLTYMEQDDFLRAIADFDRAIELDLDNYSVYWARGDAYYFLENFDQALENYHRYLELAGDSAAPFVVERVQELEAMLEE